MRELNQREWAVSISDATGLASARLLQTYSVLSTLCFKLMSVLLFFLLLINLACSSIYTGFFRHLLRVSPGTHTEPRGWLISYTLKLCDFICQDFFLFSLSLFQLLALLSFGHLLLILLFHYCYFLWHTSWAHQSTLFFTFSKTNRETVFVKRTKYSFQVKAVHFYDHICNQFYEVL